MHHQVLASHGQWDHLAVGEDAPKEESDSQQTAQAGHGCYFGVGQREPRPQVALCWGSEQNLVLEQMEQTKAEGKS